MFTTAETDFKLVVRQVFHQDGHLAVTFTQQAPVVDVGRADDSGVIVHNHQLTVNVDQLRHLEFTYTDWKISVGGWSWVLRPFQQFFSQIAATSC